MKALRSPPWGMRSKATTGTPAELAWVTIEPPDALETGSMISTDGFLLSAVEARSSEAWSALLAFCTSMLRRPGPCALALAPSATETKNGLLRVLITSVADVVLPAPASAEGLLRLQAASERAVDVATATVRTDLMRMVVPFCGEVR